MITNCSFQNLTIPEIIRKSRADIEEYRKSKNDSLLKEIKICLQEGQNMLNRSRVKASPNDEKKFKAIENCQRGVDELRLIFNSLEKGV